jgi:hypothetical protein
MKAKILLLSLMLTGCASMSQNTDDALIREPGKRTYNPPEKVAVSAGTLWEYAVLSDNVYLDTTLAQMAKTEQDKACSLDRTELSGLGSEYFFAFMARRARCEIVL